MDYNRICVFNGSSGLHLSFGHNTNGLIPQIISIRWNLCDVHQATAAVNRSRFLGTQTKLWHCMSFLAIIRECVATEFFCARRK